MNQASSSDPGSTVPVEIAQIAGQRVEHRWIKPAASRRAPAHPTLVFLHEGLGSTGQWRTFPDRVAEAAGCAALVYSRQGYGRSEPRTQPRTVDYMHREALERLPALLEHFGIDEPVLIGHSDGASISLIHAGARVRPVRGVVAIAPHVFVEDVSVSSIAQAREAFLTTDLAQRMAKYHEDVASTFWGWNDIWLHPDFRTWNIEQYLSAIDCPMMLIQGLDDEYGTLKQIDAIAAQVDGPVEKVLLEHCKHSPHKDRKEDTLEAILRFVRRLTAQ